MQIAVIGSGNVGGRLGRLWAEHGHEVTFGVRDPNSEKARLLAGPNIRVTSIPEAAGADVIALAVPFGAVAETLGLLGKLSGKVLIDCTNRIGPPAPGAAASGGEEVARLAPGARVVKAFNTIGADNLANLQFGDVRAAGFICGDDAEAKAVVAGLAEELGFDPIDCGPLAAAGTLEQMTVLWIRLSREMGREIAYAIVRR
jgi:predicted dinucleotide-binding enzyme